MEVDHHCVVREGGDMGHGCLLALVVASCDVACPWLASHGAGVDRTEAGIRGSLSMGGGAKMPSRPIR